MAKKLVKKQSGGSTVDKSKLKNKTVRIGEDSKDYVTKIKTDDKGDVSSMKVRRTVKGVLTGAPSPRKLEKQVSSNKMKYGGFTKSKKK